MFLLRIANKNISVRFFGAGVAVVGFLLAVPAQASLLGTSVTGAEYDVSGTPGTFSSTNYFDPANDLVPAGYGNSASDIVTITDPGVEFALLYSGGIDRVTADFTASGLSVNELVNYSGGLTGFRLVFTDTAFAGLNLTKTSDTFGNGGFTSSLSGDTLTLTVGPNCILGPGCSWAQSSTATWTLSGSSPPPTTPEPATVWLMLAGLGGMGFLGMRRRRA
jgi:hypothetical protein